MWFHEGGALNLNCLGESKVKNSFTKHPASSALSGRLFPSVQKRVIIISLTSFSLHYKKLIKHLFDM